MAATDLEVMYMLHVHVSSFQGLWRRIIWHYPSSRTIHITTDYFVIGGVSSLRTLAWVANLVGGRVNYPYGLLPLHEGPDFLVLVSDERESIRRTLLPKKPSLILFDVRVYYF